MFAKDQQGHTILGESRNLSDLACIVQSDHAIKVLEETGKISEAYLYTDGPQTALQRAMQETQEKIQSIWNMLPKIKPLTEEHASMSQQLFEDARDIRNYIRDKMDEE